MSVELEETQPASRDSRPSLPARISRFEVARKLGEGGNGVVMLGRDPLLDRNVAIKILRRAGDAEASARLQREAQSAAKLAHENVIVIHEVGTFEDQIFVAMEYVAGSTLTAWQRGKPWREVLAVYQRAARGLAAAHAAGLVHRDFKPDNVLVGDDGRVRVTDFGLVSVSGTETSAVRELEGAALSTTLTRTGTVMGTPRYMAPEQHLGEAVDGRTDQFAFCVALYEALFGTPPFTGDTYGALADHVLAGEVVPPPPSSGVPPRVRAAVLRGLARKPEDRFPSMTVLFAELTPATPTRWRWIAPLVVAAVFALALGTFFIQRSHRETVREAFDRAQDAYMHGDFATAAAGFHHAFELDPDLDARGPVYLYNMAAAYRKLGNCREAVIGFRRYLALAENGSAHDRATVEHILAELGDCSGSGTGSATR